MTDPTAASPSRPPQADPPIDVRAVARLARLHVPEQAIGTLAGDLADILAHVQVLNALDLDGVQPLAHASDLLAMPAEDRPAEPMPHQVLCDMAPQMDGPFIAVPKVL